MSHDHVWNTRKVIEDMNTDGAVGGGGEPGYVKPTTSPKLPGVEMLRNEDGTIDEVTVRMHCTKPGCFTMMFVTIYRTGIVNQTYDILSEVDQEIHRKLYP